MSRTDPVPQIYIFAILARGFFGDNNEIQEKAPLVHYHFQTIPRSMASLLQVMTFDSWATDMANPLGDIFPFSWMYFCIFIILVALGLLNLLTGVFLKALMDLTEENKEKAVKKARKQKKKVLNIVSSLFRQFDLDGGGTLDEEELPLMLDALEPYKDRLLKVGIPFDKLKQACAIADYDLTRRRYDPNEDRVYHTQFRFPPRFEVMDTNGNGLVERIEFEAAVKWETKDRFDELDADGDGCLTKVEYDAAYGHILNLEHHQGPVPEGVMEGELVDCLMTMDDPVCKADVYALRKQNRLLQKQVSSLETTVQNIDANLRKLMQHQNVTPIEPPIEPDDADVDPANVCDPQPTQAPSASPQHSPKPHTESGGPAWVAFTEMASSMFRRYDLDESGTINSSEEMEQLCLNLLCKLGIKPQKGTGVGVSMSEGFKSAMDAFMSQHGGPPTIQRPLSIEEFQRWFWAEFDCTNQLSSLNSFLILDAESTSQKWVPLSPKHSGS